MEVGSQHNYVLDNIGTFGCVARRFTVETAVPRAEYVPRLPVEMNDE